MFHMLHFLNLFVCRAYVPWVEYTTINLSKIYFKLTIRLIHTGGLVPGPRSALVFLRLDVVYLYI